MTTLKRGHWFGGWKVLQPSPNTRARILIRNADGLHKVVDRAAFAKEVSSA